MTHDRRFYVYAFLRKDGTPYYIGKGEGNRIDSPKGRRFKLPPKDQRKVLAGSLTEPEAFEYEIALIHCLGRKDQGAGCLRNLTDGGDGPSGAVRSPEHRAKISAFQTGRIRSPEHQAKISAANKGRTFGPETRAKVSAALKGHGTSPETRAKLSAATAAQHAAKRALREALSGQLSLLPQEVTA